VAQYNEDDQYNANQYNEDQYNVNQYRVNYPGSSSGLTCPKLGSKPPTCASSYATNQCWSVGQPDVDCEENALCCFNGCDNVCFVGNGAAGRPKNEVIKAKDTCPAVQVVLIKACNGSNFQMLP
jgi:hypothetical protein